MLLGVASNSSWAGGKLAEASGNAKIKVKLTKTDEQMGHPAFYMRGDCFKIFESKSKSYCSTFPEVWTGTGKAEYKIEILQWTSIYLCCKHLLTAI